MRYLRAAMLVLCAGAPVASHAAGMVWSTCQTVTAVSNYIPYNGAIYLALSPGISGCTGNSGGAASAVGFVVGQLSVTDTNITGLLATTLTAMTAGSSVMVYYDSSSVPTCNAQLIAIHGFAAQCP